MTGNDVMPMVRRIIVGDADLSAVRMKRKPRGRRAGGWRSNARAERFMPAKFFPDINGGLVLTKHQTGGPVRRSRGALGLVPRRALRSIGARRPRSHRWRSDSALFFGAFGRSSLQDSHGESMGLRGWDDQACTRRYRTTDWKSYNEALKQRGSLLIWLDKDMADMVLGPGVTAVLRSSAMRPFSSASW